MRLPSHAANMVQQGWMEYDELKEKHADLELDYYNSKGSTASGRPSIGRYFGCSHQPGGASHQ